MPYPQQVPWAAANAAVTNVTTSWTNIPLVADGLAGSKLGHLDVKLTHMRGVISNITTAASFSYVFTRGGAIDQLHPQVTGVAWETAPDGSSKVFAALIDTYDIVHEELTGDIKLYMKADAGDFDVRAFVGGTRG